MKFSFDPLVIITLPGNVTVGLNVISANGIENWSQLQGRVSNTLYKTVRHQRDWSITINKTFLGSPLDKALYDLALGEEPMTVYLTRLAENIRYKFTCAISRHVTKLTRGNPVEVEFALRGVKTEVTELPEFEMETGKTVGHIQTSVPALTTDFNLTIERPVRCIFTPDFEDIARYPADVNAQHSVYSVGKGLPTDVPNTLEIDIGPFHYVLSGSVQFQEPFVQPNYGDCIRQYNYHGANVEVTVPVIIL